MIDYRCLTAKDAADCWAFYLDVYVPEFPLDQIETPTIWLRLMRADASPHVRVILASDNQHIIGGIVFEEYQNTRSWLLTYLVVRPEYRCQGVANGLLKEMLRFVQDQPFPLLFTEVDPSDPVRLLIFAKLGFRRVLLDYVQPALSSEQPTVSNFWLMVHLQNNVLNTRVRSFLAEYYASLHQLPSPDLTRMDAKLGDETAQVWTQPLVDQDYTSASAEAYRPWPEFPLASSAE